MKLAPDLVPAARSPAGSCRGAAICARRAKIVEAAWKAQPASRPRRGLPESAPGRFGARPPASGRDPGEALVLAPPKARLALARAALEAREFGRAREALRPLLAERPTVRACLMMADIEQAEHGATGQGREWLARAARAPRDPVWIADGVVSDRWAPVSPVTGRLDAFVWEAPPDVLAAPGLA